MEFPSSLLLISLLLPCIYFLVSLARKRPGHGNLPPGPVPLPIVGSLFKLGNKPNESLARLAKLHGPLMTLHLGSVPTVVVSSASMAKLVLQKNDQVFAGRTVVDAVRVLNYEDASMVWLQPNSAWRKLRMLCNTHIFTTQRLDASQALRRHKVQELLAYVREHCREGKSVDIGKAAFAATFNLVSNTLFSVDLVDPNSESAQEFKELVWNILEEAGKPNLSDYFHFLRAVDPQGIRRRMKGYFGRLHATFDEIIHQRLLLRSSPDYCGGDDFLDPLLDHSQDSNHRDIKALLTDIFVAGSDTSSTTLEWAMAELLRDPKIMGKARAEIMETIGPEKEVEESDMGRLPYLQAVVKETFRLHPAAPLLIPHRAESDVQICGDADAWEQPTSFIPERFIGSQVDFKGQNFELIPFGAGRRICPGMPLAHRMVHLILASLLHSFSWRLPDGVGPHDMDMNSKFGITLQMEAPLFAIPMQDASS
ncbi:hypothetical protein ACLOJK_033543 [Asimina triloba]